MFHNLWTLHDRNKEETVVFFTLTNSQIKSLSRYKSVSWIIMNRVRRHPLVSPAPPRRPWLPGAVAGAVLLIPLLSLSRQLGVTDTLLTLVQSRKRGLFLSAMFQTHGYGHAVQWFQFVSPCLPLVTSQHLITTWAKLLEADLATSLFYHLGKCLCFPSEEDIQVVVHYNKNMSQDNKSQYFHQI